MTSPPIAGVELVAAAVALVAIVVLHVLPTGLSPLHRPVSQYGITRYRLGYRVLTLALGVAGLAAAAAVSIGYPPQQRSAIVALLVVFGLCRLVISWSPMDAPGAPRSAHGIVHVVLAIGAFGSIAVAADRMRHAVAGQAATFGSGYHGAVVVAFWLLVVGLAGMLMTGRRSAGHRFFGVAERLIYVGIFVLLFATGIALV